MFGKKVEKLVVVKQTDLSKLVREVRKLRTLLERILNPAALSNNGVPINLENMHADQYAPTGYAAGAEINYTDPQQQLIDEIRRQAGDFIENPEDVEVLYTKNRG